MIHKAFIVSTIFTLPACSMGSHVEPLPVSITKYSCQYSPSLWQQDRRIAVCDTQDECNKICEANRQKEGK